MYEREILDNLYLFLTLNMATLKITKKHHRHLNNPFPGNPNFLPFIQGTLFPSPQTIPSHQIFPIGKDFQLTWISENGGSLSICHQSQPTRPIWSTIPGQAFVSTAMAETEIEESRGSFVIKDRNIQLVCDHQTVEEIRVINLDNISLQSNDHDLLCAYGGFDSKTELISTQSPVLLITGRIFSVKRKKNTMPVSGIFVEKEVSTSAKYWVLFDQKKSNQIGFQVRLGKPNLSSPQRLSPRTYRDFAKKFGRTRRLRVQVRGLFSRQKGFSAVSSAEEENVAMKDAETADFNRICLTYASERNERFFGFGEQFSHMDFKGRRVPIFVQEQGIGRGDQPITFAANLVSYRAGGDWSTTYAPSPFYMTSKMRSLYLEGYNYSVFDLTRHDRVQIQIHGDIVEGRILHGNSPSELIEQFTESIGRPPALPEWIISGAVVGMQGGTDTVRHVWDELFDDLKNVYVGSEIL